MTSICLVCRLWKKIMIISLDTNLIIKRQKYNKFTKIIPFNFNNTGLLHFQLAECMISTNFRSSKNVGSREMVQ